MISFYNGTPQPQGHISVKLLIWASATMKSGSNVMFLATPSQAIFWGPINIM
jgi:hypothetical protein